MRTPIRKPMDLSECKIRNLVRRRFPHFNEAMWSAIAMADEVLGSTERPTDKWLDIVANELPDDGDGWLPEDDVKYDNDPIYGEISTHDRQRLRLLIEAAHEEEQALRSLSRKEIEALYDQALEADRGFNKTSAVPNYSFWTGRESWQVDEAVALSLGRDPKTISWSELQKLVSKSPFAAQYEQRRDDVLRAIEAKREGLHPFIDPAMFIKWAESRNLDLPAELREPSVEEKYMKKRRDKVRSINRSFHHIRRNAVYRLLLGLAQKHGLALPYEPGDKSNAFTAIAHELPPEFRVGEKTLRNLVREASQWGHAQGLFKKPQK